ncbi:MAG: hypothetical protein GTO03_13125 [Planctomycetales bacterium]|nr:hypothetical protein [Planctomycetales bacterium]
MLELLVCGPSPTGRERLTAALQLDPPLALWALLHGPPSCGSVPSVQELVADLLDQLPVRLQWPAAQAFDVPPSAEEGFLQLATRSVAAARKAAETAMPQGQPDRERAYLQGLVSAAPDWVERCQGGPGQAMPAWPAWLEWIPRTSASADGQRQPSDPEAERWWTQRVGLVDILPMLGRRLRRLQQLEEEFAATLEDAKLKALYTLAAGAGHEINNPLGSIAGRAQLLLRDERDVERRRTLAKINSQAFRAHEMISDMMLFAKPPQPVREALDVIPLVREVLDSLQEQAQQCHTAISCQGPPQPIMLHADRAQLAVGLRAMCLNSIEALGGGGHLEVTVGVVGEGPSRTVEIAVRDDGPGISPQQRQHIFDPFFSGREAGRGLGFGLSKTWRIVQNHGGRIDVQSAPGQGATFRICLPAA